MDTGGRKKTHLMLDSFKSAPINQRFSAIFLNENVESHSKFQRQNGKLLKTNPSLTIRLLLKNVPVGLVSQ